jgi:hypothetical protein
MSRVPVPLPPGTTTGRVTVGRCVLHVGAEAGTVLESTKSDDPSSRVSLAAALDEQGVEPASAPDRLVGAVEAAEEVTRRVERLSELFVSIATGRILTSEFLKKEVDGAFDLLRRLDKADRFEEVLKVAQHLVRALMLLGRWATVIQTLRIAFRAASAHANTAAEAWVRNELGSLATGAGDDATAARLLRESLRLREQAGEELAARVTRHNLQEATRAARSPLLRAERPFLRRLWVRLGAAAGATLALTVALLVIGGNTGDRVPAQLPKVEITSGPNARTHTPLATFAFRADRPTRGFECKLDEGPFTTCDSPYQHTVRPRRHSFRVRAIGLDGTSGLAASYAWVVLKVDTSPPEPDDPARDGTRPRVRITDRPRTRTTSRTASFAFTASEDVRRFECSVDRKPFRLCTSPHSIRGPLDVRVHRFDLRAIDLAGNTGKAPRQFWRVLAPEGPSVALTRTPPRLTNERVARFGYRARGAERFACRLDEGDFAPCAETQAYRRLKDGPHEFAVRAVDAAGRAGAVATWKWTVDTVAPTVTPIRATFASGGEYEVQYDFAADDPAAEFECTTDPETPFESCHPPLRFKTRPALLLVRAFDEAENQSETAEWRPSEPRDYTPK